MALFQNHPPTRYTIEVFTNDLARVSEAVFRKLPSFAVLSVGRLQLKPTQLWRMKDYWLSSLAFNTWLGGPLSATEPSGPPAPPEGPTVELSEVMEKRVSGDHARPPRIAGHLGPDHVSHAVLQDLRSVLFLGHQRGVFLGRKL